MKLSVLLCLILFTQTVSISLASEPVWLQKMKQIRLLESNKNDVIKLFGERSNNDRENHVWFYDFKEGQLTVMYSTGVCVSNSLDTSSFKGWDVPQWNVIEVSFNLEKHISPKKLKISLDDFEPTPIYDAPNAFEYSNNELGIDYVINNGKVEEVTFRPKSSLNYLQCK